MTASETRRAHDARFDDTEQTYDAVLIVSFGGPERPEDVMPFLENVLRGRNVPEARKLEVAEHYALFGGASPINEQNLSLMRLLRAKLNHMGHPLPVYVGNRNWHPLIEETLREMARDGAKHAVACFPSAFSCYSSCRQYRENINAARHAVGRHAPTVDKIRGYYNHPRFIEANVDSVLRAATTLPESHVQNVHLVCTAHSIPESMASCSDYVRQLEEASQLVATASGVRQVTVAFQSRSGPPHIPWLGPDINEHLADLGQRNVRAVIVLPIGFITDHIEVKFDLDTEAMATAAEIGLTMVRADTVGLSDTFITMWSEMIIERMTANPPRPALGSGPHHDICPLDCCLSSCPAS